MNDATSLDGGGEIIFKLQRQSTGWMGFGIDPADASVNGMQETDMYIAWIDPDSTVHIMDAWSVGFMPPTPDADQGGENSILQYAGEEKDGITTVVFKRKVDTGDTYDRVIKSATQVREEICSLRSWMSSSLAGYCVCIWRWRWFASWWSWTLLPR